jgi:hypothetical protein
MALLVVVANAVARAELTVQGAFVAAIAYKGV